MGGQRLRRMRFLWESGRSGHSGYLSPTPAASLYLASNGCRTTTITTGQTLKRVVSAGEGHGGGLPGGERCLHRKDGVDLRVAAYIVALERLAAAMKARGWV